jgi:hypothetical protein
LSDRRPLSQVRRDPDAYGLQPVPRLALTIDEAAASIGVSESHFRRHVLDHLKVVYNGGARLIPIGELVRWLDSTATLAGIHAA